MEFNILKPDIAIAHTAKLDARQLDFINFLFNGAYKQLDQNYVRDTFTFSINEIKKFNPRLKSKKMIDEFIDDIYDKDFEFNILGKDKSVEANVKSRFITLLKKNGTDSIEVGLEPLTIQALRKMIIKKKNIQIEGYENLKLNSYAKFVSNNIKFYPAKVVRELCYSYKNFEVPLIDVDKFKTMTNTVDKYKNDYNRLVIKKIKKLLELEIENFDISLIKEGRKNKWVKITSDINKRTEYFKEFYKREFLDKGMEDNHQNRIIATKTYELKHKGGKNG